jgi:hypothetical protein
LIARLKAVAFGEMKEDIPLPDAGFGLSVKFFRRVSYGWRL